MKKTHLSFIAVLLVAMVAQAQSSLEDWAKQLAIFGRSVPQEEVFLHMDNTSYYVGDTLRFKAYTWLSTGEPSKLSGLLYVELLNNDGYLVERQNIQMKDGQGDGAFLLEDSLYGGYYELRAYTRWQLNWGRYEHPHTNHAEKWFYSKRMAKEYYRDYDKLYSRVFPVYDKPREPGYYNQDMTLRPMRRYYKIKSERPEADLTFYPEGGNLIDGTTCRVAFEANDQDGQHLKGTLTVTDNDGNVVATAPTESRGRGSFDLRCEPGKRYEATFKWGDSYASKEKLPKSETDGCAIKVTQVDGKIHMALQCRGTAAQEELGLTVMSHGVLKKYTLLGKGETQETDIETDKFPNGVLQLTVFNAQGRVYADRLVFVTQPDFKGQNIQFSGVTDKPYKPFDAISFDLKGQPGSTVSVAVRDTRNSEYTFDSGNILTEMLLTSQIKGFVEQPEYFFESNDEEHRRALDLLLMIQGWRRYDWVEMATPKRFVADEPYEHSQWIYGEVNRYTAEEPENMFADAATQAMDESMMSGEAEEFKNEYPEWASPDFIRKWNGLGAAKAAAHVLKYRLGGDPESYDFINRDPLDYQIEMNMASELGKKMDEKRQAGIQKMDGNMAAERFNESEGNLKHEVTVHAEFMLGTKVKKGLEKGAVGDMETYNHGQFRIQAPSSQSYCYFFCTASDHTKWKDGKEPTWIVPSESKVNIYGNGEIEFPEFYVRFRQPYPRFVKPYNYYQVRQNMSPRSSSGKLLKVDDAIVLNGVTVGAKHNGLKKFDASKPAMVLEAYDAFNDVCDAGFCPGYYLGAGRFVSDIARTYIGDMNMERSYPLEARFNKHNLSYNCSPGELEEFNHLPKLNKVYIYTDYSPRLEGDKRYAQDNQPLVTVDLRTVGDGTRFATYRDRRSILWGYSVCTDFYSPDYSTKPLPNTADYRRTLYWNPNVKLDDQGHAQIKLYNNNSNTQITLSAEGLSPNGVPLTGISYPEDR